jgi:hypothetical protein
LPILILFQKVPLCFKLFGVDPFVAKGDLFEAGNFETGSFFDGSNE